MLPNEGYQWSESVYNNLVQMIGAALRNLRIMVSRYTKTDSNIISHMLTWYSTPIVVAYESQNGNANACRRKYDHLAIDSKHRE
jgi:hypothetical protein